MGHDWEWAAPALLSTTVTHRHPNRMYSQINLSRSLNLDIDCENLRTRYNITSLCQVVLTSQTYSYRLIILIYTDLYRYSYNVIIAKIL